jgi:hypothetical protein
LQWKFIPIDVNKQQEEEPSLPPSTTWSPPAFKKSPPFLPTLIPSPSPLLVAPEKPIKLIAVPTVTSTVTKITWEDGVVVPSSTVESYEVRCVAAFSGCSGLLRGTPQTGIARGTQQGTVTGLVYKNEWRYTCFVVARNAAGEVCSDPIDISAPDMPTNIVSVFVSQISWLASWEVGASGYPEEVYSLKCVQQGAGCYGAALGTSGELIVRWKKQGSILNLPSDTYMNCYVIAENSAGRVCSVPQAVVTPKRATKSVAG